MKIFDSGPDKARITKQDLEYYKDCPACHETHKNRETVRNARFLECRLLCDSCISNKSTGEFNPVYGGAF